jgi:hypothetical protein
LSPRNAQQYRQGTKRALGEIRRPRCACRAGDRPACRHPGAGAVSSDLKGSGISGVRFTSVAPSSVRSDVYLVWNEKKMPSVLPEMISFFQARKTAASR